MQRLPFKKILIANRGEIALRVIRACKDLNIASVAVFTSVDREGLWIRKADEAFELKGFQGREGYLNIEAILAAAKQLKAGAIHPGYGFLSEDADFSKACREKRIVFIGPSSPSMKASGDKTNARQLAASLGIPVLSGTGPLANWEEAVSEAKPLGYPVVLKAAAGGGGRGMRLVSGADQMKASFESATHEALTSFGDGTLFLEKYLANPRHVEIQVLADHHGNVIHLGERECSIQRRYQKLIEEAPSPLMDPTLREKMGECALRLVRATGYTNAGTVEFLVDENRNFYFLEMNTRLQVEHPVTEMITGLDLVQSQIRIAEGQKLPWKQEEIHLEGWAFEARVNCEDPNRNFLPSPGRITRLEIPGGPSVRVDSALYPGYEIPGEFDSLIAKLIAWGPTRLEAIHRMNRALSEFVIDGIPTTLPFHRQIFSHPEFQKGRLSTGFLQQHSKDLALTPTEEETRFAAIAAAVETRKISPEKRCWGQSTEGQSPTNNNRWGQAARLENVSPLP